MLFSIKLYTYDYIECQMEISNSKLCFCYYFLKSIHASNVRMYVRLNVKLLLLRDSYGEIL